MRSCRNTRDIGSRLGARDHTYIVMFCRAVARKAAEDEEFSKLVQDMERSIRSCADRSYGAYTALPTSEPIAAVAAIATAPQNTTRRVGFITPAPPARAPMAPRAASPNRQASDTIHAI